MAEDNRDAARQAFNAGVDMEMVTDSYATHMAELVQSGAVSLERLDDACRGILTAKFKLGLFEQPYTQPGLAEEALFTPATGRRAQNGRRVSLSCSKRGRLATLE